MRSLPLPWCLTAPNTGSPPRAPAACRTWTQPLTPPPRWPHANTADSVLRRGEGTGPALGVEDRPRGALPQEGLQPGWAGWGAPTEKSVWPQSAFLSSSLLLPQKAGVAASPAYFAGGKSDWAGLVHTLGLLWSLCHPRKKVGRFHFGRAHHLPVADKGTRCGAMSSSFLFGEGIQPAPHGLLPHSRREPSQMCSPCSLQTPWAEEPPPPPRHRPGRLRWCFLSDDGEPRRSALTLGFLLSEWERDSGSRHAGLEADQSDPLSSSSGLFVRRCAFLLLFFTVALAFLPRLSLAWQASSPGQDVLAAVPRSP